MDYIKNDESLLEIKNINSNSGKISNLSTNNSNIKRPKSSIGNYNNLVTKDNKKYLSNSFKQDNNTSSNYSSFISNEKSVVNSTANSKNTIKTINSNNNHSEVKDSLWLLKQNEELVKEMK